MSLPESKWKTVAMSKRKLVEEIDSADTEQLLNLTQKPKQNVKPIQMTIRQLQIESTEVATEKLKPGWEGRRKGLAKVLWEC